MAKVLTEYNGHIFYKEVSFLNRYSKDQKLHVYECKSDMTNINTKYNLDYHSSIWISKEKSYQEFAQRFEVISGSWYGNYGVGEWTGGRWHTLKRTYGEIQFQGVRNLIRKEPNRYVANKFKTIKPSFSNKIIVLFSSHEVGECEFECKSITFKPSGKIALYSKSSGKFIDFTNKLNETGLILIE